MGMGAVIYSCQGYDEKSGIQNYVEIIKKKSAEKSGIQNYVEIIKKKSADLRRPEFLSQILYFPTLCIILIHSYFLS